MPDMSFYGSPSGCRAPFLESPFSLIFPFSDFPQKDPCPLRSS